jgi:hypothetical protein
MNRGHFVTAVAVSGLLANAPPAAAGGLGGCYGKVRITAPAVSDRRLEGTLLDADPEAVSLWRKGHPSLRIPRTSIVRVEECRQAGRKGRGAAKGALAGLAAALVLGAMAAGEDSPGYVSFDYGEAFALSALLTVPLGTWIGMGLAPEEEWRTTRLDDIRIGVAPTRGGGMRAALALRF